MAEHVGPKSCLPVSLLKNVGIVYSNAIIGGGQIMLPIIQYHIYINSQHSKFKKVFVFENCTQNIGTSITIKLFPTLSFIILIISIWFNINGF
jgi:hypothetical protein